MGTAVHSSTAGSRFVTSGGSIARLRGTTKSDGSTRLEAPRPLREPWGPELPLTAPGEPSNDSSARWGGGRFEIGIREAETGQWMTWSGSAAEVLERLPWLKRMNAQGNEIYVRPAREGSANALVLVGDLARGPRM